MRGFISRNGKNLTVPEMITGLKNGLNVGADFGALVGQVATASNPNPLAGEFDLDMLREHNFPIEHDMSLSRLDIYQGDNLDFNQGVFNQVLKAYGGRKTATIPVGASAIWKRYANQRKLDGGKLIYGPRQLFLSLGETALYLSVMGDPVTGRAPLSYVKSLFGMSNLYLTQMVHL